MFRRARSALTALACTLLFATASPAMARAGGSAPHTATLALGRHCLSVRPQARLVQVVLAHVQPGRTYGFTMIPQAPGGFGGGNMGSYRSDTHGTVHFAYPFPHLLTEVGYWVVSALSGPSPVAKTNFLMLHRSCSGVPVPPSQSHQ